MRTVKSSRLRSATGFPSRPVTTTSRSMTRTSTFSVNEGGGCCATAGALAGRRSARASGLAPLERLFNANVRFRGAHPARYLIPNVDHDSVVALPGQEGRRMDEGNRFLPARGQGERRVLAGDLAHPALFVHGGDVDVGGRSPIRPLR